MKEEFTEAQYLDARRKFLFKMREELNWTTEETAKKLKVMETEYIDFEKGRSKNLADYEWDDIKFFLTSHLKKLEEL